MYIQTVMHMHRLQWPQNSGLESTSLTYKHACIQIYKHAYIHTYIYTKQVCALEAQDPQQTKLNMSLISPVDSYDEEKVGTGPARCGTDAEIR